MFYKSGNASIGSATVVANNESLGAITWYGAQQTGTFATQNPAARIEAEKSYDFLPTISGWPYANAWNYIQGAGAVLRILSGLQRRIYFQ